MKTWYRIRNAGVAGEADVYVYSDIGAWGIGAEEFVAELDALDVDVINLRINSYGGEVFDAFAMFNAIRNHAAHVIAHVDGIAASAATLPMLAADEIRIAANAMVMIHNPLVEWASGNAKDLRKQADVLDRLGATIAQIYADRSGQDVEAIVEQMDDETWLDADQAVAGGFADAVADEAKEVPADPQNRVRRYLNKLNARPHVRPSDRLKALGLSALLQAGTQTPARAAEKDPTMDPKKKRALARRRAAIAAAAVVAAAVWPDASEVEEGVQYGPNGDDYTGELVVEEVDEEAEVEDEVEKKPANRGGRGGGKAAATAGTPATVEQIKAEFKDDAGFALERVSITATLTEHKAAFADHLKKKLATNQGDLSRARQELAKYNPASAGVGGAIATGDEGSAGNDKVESPLAALRQKRAAAMARRK